ncbi:MAG: NAD(P)H-hydrate epimerase [Spirochaetales bacterium]|uniref:Bifunctional NAD(P)H-hydrate repair enzyme n=1 Tax=Candidatus Thalassospirochaeta sargassi TaxID=3119039 RepID=A0AAJ1MP20_9SPIO|nr:NAD(P)H-hydrate epimerase [Spirochaetales bacterium]
MNIVSSFRMKEIDRISIEERGFGNLLLMENAGIRILEAALNDIDFNKKTVVCAAGSGNNGGDSLVIARQLYSQYNIPVSVIICKDKGSEAFEFHLKLCKNLGIDIFNAGSNADSSSIKNLLANSDIVFDGISGTGISGALRGTAAELTKLINSFELTCLAIDLPSGTGESFRAEYPALRADYTYTVGLPKRSLYLPSAREYCGDIRRVRIGFPGDLTDAVGAEPDGRDWRLINKDDIQRLSPKPGIGDYKNSRGHLAVFAGSPGTSGAASLCAEAGLRSSAGLVSLFADEDTYPVLAGRHKAVMIKPEPDGDSNLPDLSKYQAAAAGPGWGLTEKRSAQLRRIITESRGVLDADALTLLAALSVQEPDSMDLGCRWVLTSHAGEFRRLIPGIEPLENPYAAVPAAAEKYNAVVLLKGSVSFIAAPDGRSAVLDGCYPRLGTAGSGDLLCGIIAGYAASGMDLFDAAVLGAAVHLNAARLCGVQRRWFTADELIDYIGRIS